MLKDMKKEDYYMFRIPYWDWRKEKQTDNNSPLKANRLGQTVDNNGLPQVHGIMPSEFLNNWETYWRKKNILISAILILQLANYNDAL